jgi:hypothetical protein
MLGTDADHRVLVSGYLSDAGFVDVSDQQVPTTDDPLWVVQGSAPLS